MLFAVIQKKLEVLPPPKRTPLTLLAREAQFAVGPRVNREFLGILAENLTQPWAEKLVASLRGVNEETEMLPMDKIVPNPRALEIRNADCLERGFVVQDMYGGNAREHPWASVILLGAAMVSIVTTRTQLQMSDSVGDNDVGRLIDKTTTRRSLPWVLDIYTLSDAPHYRILQNQFNYDYLGARRSTYESLHNLQTMANDLARFAPKAKCSDGFRTLLDGGAMNAHPSLKTLDEENRWHLQGLKLA